MLRSDLPSDCGAPAGSSESLTSRAACLPPAVLLSTPKKIVYRLVIAAAIDTNTEAIVSWPPPSYPLGMTVCRNSMSAHESAIMTPSSEVSSVASPAAREAYRDRSAAGLRATLRRRATRSRGVAGLRVTRLQIYRDTPPARLAKPRY